MEFGASGRAWIVLLALIPLLIYLLFRRRYRRQPLGTMLILLRAYRRIRRSLRTKEMVLLALRTAAMLLFLSALLNPLFGGAAGGRPRLVLFVVDVSLSMRAGEGGKTRFDAATAFVRSELEKLTSNDRVILVAFDTEARTLGDKPLTPREAGRVLATLVPGAKGTSPEAALSALLSETEKNKGPAAEREAYLLSDFPANTWTDEKLQGTDLLERFASLSSEVRITFVDCSLRAFPNAAASAIIPGRGVFCKDLDTTLECKVSYFAEAGAENIPFTLYRGNEPMGVRTVEAAAGDSSSARFPDRPQEAGPCHYRLSVPEDALAEDNERFFAARVLEKLDVLLVDGRPGPDPFRTASGFAAAALEPSSLKDISPVKPRVMDAADFELYEGPLPKVVMLLDVPALSARSAARLKEYVRKGGGLLIACGPSVRAGELAERLGGKEGLLPARLLGVQGENGDSRTGVASMKLPEPLAGMGVLWRSGLKRLKVFSYVEAEPLPGAETPVTLESGRPLLVGGRYGAGRILLWTSSLDGEWTNLPALPMFPPLLIELCYYLAAGGESGLNITCGDTLSLRLPASEVGGGAVLSSSGGESWEFSAVTKDGEALLRYGPIESPGLYRLKTSAGAEFYVAVNPPAQESDLTPASGRALKKALKGASFRVRKAGGREETGVEPSSARSVFLAAALALLLLESLLAAVFSAPPRTVKSVFPTGGGI